MTMRALMVRLVVGCSLLVAAAPALAQNSWPTPGGSQIDGKVQMCLNASLQAVPCGAAGSTGGVVSGNVSDASSAVPPTATNVPTVSYQYQWNGATWDQQTGLNVGTPGVPTTDVLTVQGPNINGGFPTAATPISGNAAGSTAAVVGTLAGAGSKTTYICGFNVQAIGGTATVGPITIAGLVGASQVYQTDVNSATVGKQVASGSFTPCIPAIATNTAITITTTANGTATAVDVNSWGYQQ